jgi:hypothetical protein
MYPVSGVNQSKPMGKRKKEATPSLVKGGNEGEVCYGKRKQLRSAGLG